MYLLLNSNIVNCLTKINGGRNRGPNFVVFIVLSALIVSGWMVVTWSRKSGLRPAEIGSFVFLVLFNGFIRWGTQTESIISSFYFLCWSSEWGGGVSSRFACLTPGTERLSNLLQAVKKVANKLWKWTVWVYFDGDCVEFVTAGWYGRWNFTTL